MNHAYCSLCSCLGSSICGSSHTVAGCSCGVALAMPPKAKKGEGMDPTKLAKMLGVLKYHAQNGKNADKKIDADEALNVYKTLADATERKSFLEAFESNGSGKAKDSLKFAMSFSQSVTNNKGTEISSIEDHMTRS